MAGTDRVMIGPGLAAADRRAAAALWWRGLGRQVLAPPGCIPSATATRGAIRWGAAALNPAAVLAARDGRGHLIGLAGLRDGSGGMIAWDRPLRPHLGLIRACIGRVGLGLWRSGPATGDLVLDGLVVHPRWRRQGVAGRLVQAALAEAARRGHPGLHVEVFADNHPANALYARAGFGVIGRRRLGHGRRALILRRASAGAG